MSDQQQIPEIDWTTFDQHPEQTNFCVCGGPSFRSHTKMIFTGKPRLWSRKPCPSCGKSDAIWKSESDPESFSL